ncbi:glycoside hydrolase superfamily [Cercophora newfieldiana]|uniref:chitinase n=1 Tax=Cercophora newfieldiana TaxID=92897 RepID=A0AA39Y8V5_9PEZI|nr:glycoside hydrolase superfamily [Cercophora newfieldiana]
MNTERINAVYYPSWRVYRGITPATLNVKCITHILYAFIRVNEDGSLRSIDERADSVIPVDGETGALAALAKLKRQHPHLHTLVSIGGGSGSAEFPALAANLSARANFACNVKDFVTKHNFDGVDIDWEHPSTPSQGTDFLSLLHALRSAIPSPFLLTAALPTGEYILKHIDLPSAAPLLSFINLMAYDFSGPWTKTSGHHAQLHPTPGISPCTKSGAAGVAYFLRHGVPASKIVLGVPTYAHCFAGVSALGAQMPSSAKGACTTVEYRDLDEACVRNATVCTLTGAASYVDPDGKGFMSFDVPATVRMKGRFVRDEGLGGLVYWTGAGDRAAGGGDSLVEAGFRELSR